MCMFVVYRPKSVFSQCSMRRPTIVGPGMAGRPATLMDAPSIAHGQVLKVIVNRDDKGYGMKVSGDKPVYVQSVKEGELPISQFIVTFPRN